MAEPNDLTQIGDDALANLLAILRASDKREEIASGLREIARILEDTDAR